MSWKHQAEDTSCGGTPKPDLVLQEVVAWVPDNTISIITAF